MFVLLVICAVGTKTFVSAQMDTNTTFSPDCESSRNRGDYCSSQPQTQMFYYDSVRGVCQPFMFNGCGGNGNKFPSAADCRRFCVERTQPQIMKDDSTAVDSQKEEMRAACKAEYSLRTVNPQQCSESQQCNSGYECNNGWCCGTPQHICLLTYDTGRFAVGGSKLDNYFFDPRYNTCMRFSFYGALGNENNFPDYNSCMRHCSVMVN